MADPQEKKLDVSAASSLLHFGDALPCQQHDLCHEELNVFGVDQTQRNANVGTEAQMRFDVFGLKRWCFKETKTTMLSILKSGSVSAKVQRLFLKWRNSTFRWPLDTSMMSSTAWALKYYIRAVSLVPLFQPRQCSVSNNLLPQTGVHIGIHIYLHFH